jgi:preprotein translocase subunit YajC
MDDLWILAQAGSDEAEAPSTIDSAPVSENSGYEGSTKADGSPPDSNAPPGGGGPPGSPFGLNQLIIFGLMFLVMYFLLFRGPRKKQQQHKQMVQSLERNDRVRTVGGIIGTVVDVKEDEITLKVDETNNTKIKIVSSAIGKNLSKEGR